MSLLEDELTRNGFRAANQRPFSPLTATEQNSMLDSIGANALSGIGYLGGSLSKAFGGRAVRGLLGGRPEELASIIPFSDALGITNPANEVHGSDLLGGDHDTPFLSPEGLGGLGVDLLTDPATYFGGAMVKGIGKGAQIAGKAAAKTIPGAAHVGELGWKIYDPLRRGTAALFEGAAGGQMIPELQDVSRGVHAAIPKAVASAREQLTPLMMEMNELAGYKGGPVTQVVKDNLKHLGQEFGMRVEGNFVGPAKPGMQNIVDSYNTMMGRNLLETEAAGREAHQVAGNLGYLTREATDSEIMLGAEGKKLAPSGMPGRKEFFQEPVTLPKDGPKSINDLAVNSDVIQALPNKIAQQDYVAEHYLGYDQTHKAQWKQLNSLANSGAQLTPVQMADLEHLEAVFKQADDLANFATRVDPFAAKEAGGYFTNHPIEDALTKMQRDVVNNLKARGVSRGAALLAQDAKALGASGVPLNKVLEEAGLTITAGTTVAPHPQAMQNTLQALIAEGKLPPGSGLNALATLAVPSEAVEPLTRLVTAGTKPDGLAPFLTWFDSLTNWTKGLQTQVWPASHARNQWEAMLRNWIVGANDPTASAGMGYIKPWLVGKAWREGATEIQGISKMPEYLSRGLSDAEATKEFAKKVFEWNVPGRQATASQEIIGGVNIASKYGKEMHVLGSPRGSINPLTKLAEAIPKTLEEATPWNVAGVAGRTKDGFAPVRAGRELGTGLDEINKVSVFYAKKMQGLSDLEAYQATIAAHFDFANLSGFERNVMRRVMPFYNWQRQAIPQLFREILENPGGRTGMVLKTLSGASGHEQGFRPDYLGSGMAMPLGQEDAEGKRAYLSSGGLSIEDLANYTKPAGFLGMLNPLLKAPLELMTNKQFFTGRDLTGTVPHTGSTVGDEIVAASPLGRAVTTGRMLLDDRRDVGSKAINFLTGIRTTDVDMNAARRRAIQENAERLLAGQEGVGHTNDLYVRQEALPQLTPEQFQAYRMLQSTRRR